MQRQGFTYVGDSGWREANQSVNELPMQVICRAGKAAIVPHLVKVCIEGYDLLLSSFKPDPRLPK